MPKPKRGTRRKELGKPASILAKLVEIAAVVNIVGGEIAFWIKGSDFVKGVHEVCDQDYRRNVMQKAPKSTEEDDKRDADSAFRKWSLEKKILMRKHVWDAKCQALWGKKPPPKNKWNYQKSTTQAIFLAGIRAIDGRGNEIRITESKSTFPPGALWGYKVKRLDAPDDLVRTFDDICEQVQAKAEALLADDMGPLNVLASVASGSP